MGGKVLALLISLCSAAIILSVIIFFILPQAKKFTSNKLPESSQLKPCTITLSESMFPDKIREYVITNDRFTDANTMRASYSNGKIPTDSLKISDEVWLTIQRETDQKVDLYAQKYKIAMKGELSDEEFNQLIKEWGAKNFRLSRHNMGNITFYVIEALKPIEGTPFNVSYYDKESSLFVSFGFGEKKDNYIDYFEDWYKQVCS